jgi:hypothetical protein
MPFTSGENLLQRIAYSDSLPMACPRILCSPNKRGAALGTRPKNARILSANSFSGLI